MGQVEGGARTRLTIWDVISFGKSSRTRTKRTPPPPYVPAKASDEKNCYFDLNKRVWVNTTKEGDKIGAGFSTREKREGEREREQTGKKKSYGESRTEEEERRGREEESL